MISFFQMCLVYQIGANKKKTNILKKLCYYLIIEASTFFYIYTLLTNFIQGLFLTILIFSKKFI